MGQKLAKSISILSLCYLVFLAGIAVNEMDMTRPTVRAMKGVYALTAETYYRYFRPNTYKTKSFYWMPRRYNKSGAVVHQQDHFSGDVTLYSSSHQQGALLIDREGKVVHEWTFSYEKHFPAESQRGAVPAGETIFWRDLYLYPNGDLLATVVMDSKTPWGLGVIKLDKDSNLLWHHQAFVHHDLDVGSDQKVYQLSHDIVSQVPDNRRFIPTPVLDERFIVLNHDGELEKEIFIYDAMVNSQYKWLLKRLKKSVGGDYLHPNSIEHIDAEKAAYAEYLKENSVLINLRDIETIIAIDLESEKVIWAVSGPWYRQHDPDILANGNILIFDNRSLDLRSRVIEFDPRSHQVVWEYKGSDELPLYSKIRSEQQILNNGNVLITESNGSRILEVDRTGALVWEFYNPIVAQDEHRVSAEGGELVYSPVIMGVSRFSLDELSFLQ